MLTEMFEDLNQLKVNRLNGEIRRGRSMIAEKILFVDQSSEQSKVGKKRILRSIIGSRCSMRIILFGIGVQMNRRILRTMCSTRQETFRRMNDIRRELLRLRNRLNLIEILRNDRFVFGFPKKQGFFARDNRLFVAIQFFFDRRFGQQQTNNRRSETERKRKREITRCLDTVVSLGRFLDRLETSVSER